MWGGGGGGVLQSTLISSLSLFSSSVFPVASTGQAFLLSRSPALGVQVSE